MGEQFVGTQTFQIIRDESLRVIQTVAVLEKTKLYAVESDTCVSRSEVLEDICQHLIYCGSGAYLRRIAVDSGEKRRVSVGLRKHDDFLFHIRLLI